MDNDRIKIFLKATKSKLLWNGEVVVDTFEQELQLDENTRVEIENQLVKADIEGRTAEQLGLTLDNGGQLISLCNFHPDEMWVDFGNDWIIQLVHQRTMTYDSICKKTVARKEIKTHGSV